VNDSALIALPIIAFGAFLLKAMTGFGPMLIIVSVGSLIFPPATIIVVSSLLDLIAGGILMKQDGTPRRKRFWLSIAIAMIIGSVLGGLLLKFLSPEVFRLILSTAVLTIGVWFMFFRTNGKQKLADALPRKWSRESRIITFFSGFCGGLFGISGPPIIWYFGRMLAKERFRQTLVRLLMAGAVARVATYGATGLITYETLIYALAALPGLLLGIMVGNKVFFKLSEVAFGRVAGVALIAISVRLFLR